jgi:hypothetical protein
MYLKIIFKLLSFGRCQVCQTNVKIYSIFTVGFAGQGFLNKFPTVWLDGARPAPKEQVKTFK